MKTTYIVMSRTPKLRGKARDFSSGYRKFALVEVDPQVLAAEGKTEPSMISERSRGVVSILECDSLYYGKGISSEGARYLDKLRARAEKLNAATA